MLFRSWEEFCIADELICCKQAEVYGIEESKPGKRMAVCCWVESFSCGQVVIWNSSGFQLFTPVFLTPIFVIFSFCKKIFFLCKIIWRLVS